jgi:hypothetical protein
MSEEMKLVPIEPTTEMKTAAITNVLFDEDTRDYWQLSWEEATAIYKSMINAYQEKK